MRSCHGTRLENARFSVIVLEKRGAKAFETELAYTYLLDGRGQRLTNLISMTDDVAERSIPSGAVNGFRVFKTNGEAFTQKRPAMKTTVQKYFVSRATFLDCLLRKIAEFNSNAKKEDEVKLVRIFVQIHSSRVSSFQWSTYFGHTSPCNNAGVLKAPTFRKRPVAPYDHESSR